LKERRRSPISYQGPPRAAHRPRAPLAAHGKGDRSGRLSLAHRAAVDRPDGAHPDRPAQAVGLCHQPGERCPQDPVPALPPALAGRTGHRRGVAWSWSRSSGRLRRASQPGGHQTTLASAQSGRRCSGRPAPSG